MTGRSVNALEKAASEFDSPATDGRARESASGTRWLARRWPLSIQILSFVILPVLAIGYFSSSVMVHLETDLLLHQQEENKQHTLGLLAGASLDAVIAQDRPALETMIEQTFARDPNLTFIRIRSREGEILAERGADHSPADDHDFDPSQYPDITLTEDISLTGERFGSISAAWHSYHVAEDIRAHSRDIRFLWLSILSGILILIVVAVYGFVARPITDIHRGLARLRLGERLPDLRLPRYAARELQDLQRAVLELDDALAENRTHTEELQSAQGRFKDYVEATSDWFWETDGDLRFTFVSNRMFEVIGLRPDEAIGRRSDEIGVISPSRDEWHRQEPIIAARKSFRDLRLEYRTPDDTVIYLSASARPLHEPDGTFKGYRGTTTDITAAVEAEAAAEKAAEQLRQAQKMEAIGQLTGGVAHDFNNLLQIIDGYGRQALTRLNDRDAVKSALTNIITASERAAALTRQLLSFSRRQSMQKDVFRVNDTIREIEGLLRRSIGPAYEFRFDLGPDDACVDTDAAELSQAVLNLGINARDAMDNSGAIVIGTRIVDLDETALMAHDHLMSGKFVELFVRDEGQGIDPQVLPHIFEPFFTTKADGKGTGLGLAMVYGFSRQSGGFVDITSTVGKGTTVHIYLPAVDRRPTARQEGVAATDRANGETILLVEDEAPLRELLQDTLESIGYKVFPAANGTEALEIERQLDGHLDLLLSDVLMPGITGIELADRLRDRRRGLNVLIMSGYLQRDPSTAVQIPDYAEYIQKPFQRQNLAQAIRRMLDGAGAAAAE